MSDTPLPDPLERFLDDPPHLAPSEALRDELLSRTSAALRRPRRWRWPVALGVAASIVLALAGVYFWRPTSVEPVPNPDFVKRDEKPRNEKPPEEKPKEIASSVPIRLDPADLEWKAFDVAEDHERVQLYFKAGDLYLDRFDDYASALRCYRQALHYCEARDLHSNPNDNWLVVALKHDYRKEN